MMTVYEFISFSFYEFIMGERIQNNAVASVLGVLNRFKKIIKFAVKVKRLQ